MPQKRLDRLVINLIIADAGLEKRVPVDQAFAAIDKPLLVEAHENLGDRGGPWRIHREGIARPVD